MAIFLESYIKHSDTKFPPNSLIHTYNTHYFNDYDEAKEALMNKVLLPGEIAYFYYYDTTAPNGVNALAGLGPLKSGSGNIIFKNAQQIEDEANIINASINDIFNYMDNTSTYVLDICTNIHNNLYELNIFKEDTSLYINRLNFHINSTKYELLEKIIDLSINKANKTELSDFITKNETNSIISDLSTNLIQKINQLEQRIIDLENRLNTP